MHEVGSRRCSCELHEVQLGGAASGPLHSGRLSLLLLRHLICSLYFTTHITVLAVSVKAVLHVQMSSAAQATLKIDLEIQLQAQIRQTMPTA